jgi:hypothetical protein
MQSGANTEGGQGEEKPRGQSAQETSADRATRITARATIWIALFTFFLAGAAIYQFIILNGQLNVMRKDQRAWMNPEIVSSQFLSDKPIEVGIRFTNYGKTPARQVSIRMRMEILDSAEAPTFDYSNALLMDEIDDPLVLPNSPIPPAPLFALRQIAGTQTIQEISFNEFSEAYNAGKVWFSTEGKISYSDVVGTQHWMTFCFAKVHTPESVSTSPIETRKCAQYNDMDDK